MSKTRILRDQIHGDIEASGIIIDLIDTKEFQRLRRIKQLATAQFTFQGAEHSRFAHSIGVYYLANKIAKRLQRKYPQIWTTHMTLLASVAALLHDVGHGAFSHTFEALFGTNHEEFTCTIIKNPTTEVNRVLRKVGEQFPEQVADVIAHTSEFTLVTELISSQLDADRMDYLMRDAQMTGVSYTSIDSSKIINAIEIVDNKIVFDEKGLQAVEAFIIGRHQMYQNVYFHPANRAAEVVLQNMLKRAKELYFEKKDFFLLTSPRLVPFFEETYSLQDYLKLDDNILMAIFSLWESSGDAVLSDLASRFMNRKLLTSVTYDEPEEDLQILINKVAQMGYQTEYYTAISKNFDLPYDTSKQSSRTDVVIKTADGLTELSEVSPLIKAITSVQYGNKRFYFPKEMISDDQFKNLTKNGKFQQSEQLDLFN